MEEKVPVNVGSKILTRENRIYYWSSGDLNTEFGLIKEKDIIIFMNQKKFTSYLKALDLK